MKGKKPTKFDWKCTIPIAVVGLGMAIRVFLYLSGRSPLDGDETIMGLMAYHLGHLEHFPLYFYRQHYMGTLEIPPVAILQRLGPEWWQFSAWPIRITSLGYFCALCWSHFRLTRRFFGWRAACWMLFFLCVGPWYWVDYSLRLRHVVLMMFLGEVMALLALSVMDLWENERRVSPWRVLGLGALAGLAWWHYQLISVFFGGVAVLMLLFSRLPWEALWRRGAKYDPPILAAVRVLGMAACCLALAGLTLSWWSRYWQHYAWIILPILCGLAVLVLWDWLADREARIAHGVVPWHRYFYPLLAAGFVVGYSPSLVYLLRLNEEFWINPLSPNLTNIAARTRDLFLLEFSAMLEFTRWESPTSNLQVTTPPTYFYFLFYFIGMYVFFRLLARPQRRDQRMGVSFFLGVLVVLIVLHVCTPRSTSWTEPRFLIPAFAVTSVVLGLAVDALLDVLEKANRFARLAFGACMVAGAFALWGSVWLENPQQELDRKTGHRKVLIDLVKEFRARGIERVGTQESSNWILLGYELQFVSHLGMRLNRGAMGDRLEGIIDEERYRGGLWLLVYGDNIRSFIGPKAETPDEIARAVEAQGGFAHPPYYVVRMPPGYHMKK